MEMNRMRELLQLYLYEELSGENKREVEELIAHSSEWRAELETLKKLHATLAYLHTAEAPETLLQDARNGLRVVIRAERMRKSFGEKVTSFFAESVFAQYKVAIGGVATIAAGFLLGYAVFSTPVHESGSLFRQTSASSVLDQGESQLTNVRFVNDNAKDGIVELTFDAITPVHIKGNINDEAVTKILARAMVNEQNPGVRLRTVSTISDQKSILPATEKEVKSSLIAVLRYDQNPGVRKEALKALQKYPVDDDIVESILFVLKNEKNTGMRIAAINFLDFSKLSGRPVSKDLLDMLKEKMQSDENNYIRYRGNAAFQEIKK